MTIYNLNIFVWIHDDLGKGVLCPFQHYLSLVETTVLFSKQGFCFGVTRRLWCILWILTEFY